MWSGKLVEPRARVTDRLSLDSLYEYGGVWGVWGYRRGVCNWMEISHRPLYPEPHLKSVGGRSVPSQM